VKYLFVHVATDLGLYYLSWRIDVTLVVKESRARENQNRQWHNNKHVCSSYICSRRFYAFPSTTISVRTDARCMRHHVRNVCLLVHAREHVRHGPPGVYGNILARVGRLGNRDAARVSAVYVNWKNEKKTMYNKNINADLFHIAVALTHILPIMTKVPCANSVDPDEKPSHSALQLGVSSWSNLFCPRTICPAFVNTFETKYTF